MRFILIFILFIFSMSAFAYVDVSVNFSHKRSVFVDENIVDEDFNKAVSTTEGYSIVWAWYIWEYTALEFNYSKSTETLSDKRKQVSSSDPGTIIHSSESTVFTQVSGAGIRQAFAGRKASIIPSISIGYAKFSTAGGTKYDFETGGNREEIEIESDTNATNSGYATFSLRFKITRFLGLSLAAKTVVPDFETQKAKNNMTYLAGISWIF